MDTGCIYNIDLTTSNKDTFSVSSDNFNHFYISNIDDEGNVIAYDKTSNSNTLSANFFMIKILKNNEAKSLLTIEELNKNKNITKIGINFTNGYYQEFDLAKKRIVNKGQLVNIYEETFIDDEDLCIIITDKNIKYKKNLFI